MREGRIFHIHKQAQISTIVIVTIITIPQLNNAAILNSLPTSSPSLVAHWELYPDVIRIH